MEHSTCSAPCLLTFMLPLQAIPLWKSAHYWRLDCKNNIMRQLSLSLYLSLISLRASSQGRSFGGAENKGELAITPLEFEFHLQFPCGSPSTTLSDCPQSARSAKCECKKHWKTRAKGNDVIANVISPNQHFTSPFSMQIFKFQRRSCKLSFPSRPIARAPGRTW